ncbi:MAG: hypothetical protein U0Q11_26810 [Vicinamibacterales bacterium]
MVNVSRPLVRRRCLIFRIAALLLVLLAASPFTAPFSTCDDAVLAVHDSTSDHGAEKDTDTIAVWSVISTEALNAIWSPAFVRATAAYVGTPGPSLFALRL